MEFTSDQKPQVGLQYGCRFILRLLVHIAGGAEPQDIDTGSADSMLSGDFIYDLLGDRIVVNYPSNISCSNDTAVLTGDGLATRVEPGGGPTLSLPRTLVCGAPSRSFHRLTALVPFRAQTCHTLRPFLSVATGRVQKLECENGVCDHAMCRTSYTKLAWRHIFHGYVN